MKRIRRRGAYYAKAKGFSILIVADLSKLRPKKD
jgi:hypothetical protein